MKQFDDLIKAYATSGMDSTTVSAWYAQYSPSGDAFSELAETIGAAFLGRDIDFDLANSLLNQLMPLAGFDSAPTRFWQYYIAFEDSETSNDPDTYARPAVTAISRRGCT